MCGSDSRTYPSLCQLKRAACLRRSTLRAEHDGACREELNGSVDETIRRMCDAATARGLCSDQELCFETINARNGTREWACECAQCDSSAEDDDNEFDERQEPHSPTTPVDTTQAIAAGWVCGSDGNSYRSECLLRRHSCRSKTSIDVLYTGRCRKFDSFREFYSLCPFVRLSLCCSALPTLLPITRVLSLHRRMPSASPHSNPRPMSKGYSCEQID